MTASNFLTSLRLILMHEGGYVNHPEDPGGPTNLGVTLAVARRYGVDMDGDGDTDIVDMKKLSVDVAGKIYKGEYWDKIKGDQLPSGLDYAAFDFGVNSGIGRSARFLQEILGVKQDGAIGPNTLGALVGRDTASLIRQLCDNRLAFVKTLPTWPTFGRGWASRISAVRAKALTMV